MYSAIAEQRYVIGTPFGGRVHSGDDEFEYGLERQAGTISKLYLKAAAQEKSSYFDVMRGIDNNARTRAYSARLLVATAVSLTVMLIGFVTAAFAAAAADDRAIGIVGSIMLAAGITVFAMILRSARQYNERQSKMGT